MPGGTLALSTGLRCGGLSGATPSNDRKNGWVLITLMTAGLVVAIWMLAGPALAGLFEQAIERVSGF